MPRVPCCLMVTAAGRSCCRDQHQHMPTPLALGPAVPLARALIHAKVPGWMDEEMPAAAEGAPPLSANMQRFRCVLGAVLR